MSSTASRPRSAQTTTAPAVRRSHDAETATRVESPEHEFVGFVKAIGLGVLIGLPLLTALITVVVKVAIPEWELGAAFGIALWVSIWCGMFLAGTVTVGIWSTRQH